MKARSSTKRRRGRPQLPVSEREPNGKLSRRQSSTTSRNMENNMNVALATRIRQQELVDTKGKDGKVTTAAQHALDTRRGYVLGIMLMKKIVSQGQHDAGLKYAEDMARFFRATGIPYPTARAQAMATKSEGEEKDRPAPQALTDDERHEAAKAAEAKRVELLKALRTDPLESFHKTQTYRSMQTRRAVEHAVNLVCLGDIPEALNWPEHMHELTRIGLSRLASFYGTTN